MKKLIGIGGVVLVGLATALVALADVGNVSWVEFQKDGPDLSNPQKTAIAALINSDWGAGVAAALSREVCTQQTLQDPGAWRCTVSRDVVPNDDQYWQLRHARQIEPGDTITQTDTKILSAARVAEYSTLTQSVFSRPMDELHEFSVARDADVPATVHSYYLPIMVGTTAQFRAADEAGLVQFTVGEVSE